MYRNGDENDAADDDRRRFKACAGDASEYEAGERHRRFEEREGQRRTQRSRLAKSQANRNGERIEPEREDEG